MASKKALKSSKQELNAVATKAAAAVEASAAKTAKSARKRANKKVGKKALKGPVSNYLAAYNPYLLSVADPFRFRGARIPDPITSASTTFSLTQRWTITTPSTDGNLLIQVGCNIANSGSSPAWGAGYYRTGLVPLATTGATQPFEFSIGQVLSTADPLSFGTGGATAVLNDLQFSAWSQNNGVPTIMGSTRLVSAGAAVQYVGASIGAAGTYTTVGVSTDVLIDNAYNAGITFTNIKALPTATTTALNTMHGVAVRYLPTTASRNDYIRVNTLSDSAAAADATDIRNHAQFAMIIMVNGLNLSVTNSFELTVVANYEGLPNTNSLSFVDSGTSYSDPLAMAHASNTIANIAPALPSADMALGSPNAAGSGSSSVQPAGPYQQDLYQPLNMHESITAPTQRVSQLLNQGSTMFDQMMGEGSKMMDKVAPMIEEYGPMFEALLA